MKKLIEIIDTANEPNILQKMEWTLKLKTMTTQEVSQLATIATRYSEVNSAAKQAKSAIQEVRFKLFTNFISEEDEEILAKAMRIVEQIVSNTHQSDAVECFNQIMNEAN